MTMKRDCSNPDLHGNNDTLYDKMQNEINTGKSPDRIPVTPGQH
jgi:hypothetical protein